MIEFNKNAHVIYNDAGEKNVAAVILHPAVDGELFWDEHTAQIPVMPSELADLCLKNLVLIKTVNSPIEFVRVTSFPTEVNDTVAFEVKAGDVTYHSGTKSN